MTTAAALSAIPGIRTELFKSQERLPIGVPRLDQVIQGFPRGAISEIVGPESSGRATLANALLAAATARFEICAYVDSSDAFDPQSAAAGGVACSQLVWVRCGHDVRHALQATDLLLHAGGFGVVALDLTRAPDRMLRGVPISWWHRFRLIVENTPTILVLLGRDAQAKSCAAMILDLRRKNALWTGSPGFHLLREMEVEAVCRKPPRPASAGFHARIAS